MGKNHASQYANFGSLPNAIAAISNKRAENSMGKNNKVLY